MIGCVPCIEVLLRSPQTEVDAICDSNATALLEAIRINSVSAVRALVAPPAPLASVRPFTDQKDSVMPLIEALRQGAYDCIAPLVEAGAPLNPVQGSYNWHGPLTSAHHNWYVPLQKAIDGCESEEIKKCKEKLPTF